MSKPDGNGHDDGVGRERCAVVTITFNMATAKLTIGGTCPSRELAKALCQMGADEIERLIYKQRLEAGISIAGPELFRDLRG